MQRSLTTTWCMRLLPLGLAALAVSNAVAQQQSNPPAWSVLNLGSLAGADTYFTDFNNHGQVVGSSIPELAPSRAFVYDAGRMTVLPPIAGLPSSVAWAINDRGDVIGTAGGGPGPGQRAFLYSGGQLTALATPNGGNSSAVGINEGGAVLLSGGGRGYIYTNGKYTDIGTLGGASTTPLAINNRSQVAGESGVAGAGFFYSSGYMRPLAPGFTTSIRALNDAGQVAGFMWPMGVPFVSLEGVIFHEGQVTRLGTLGGHFSRLDDINNAGQAVGSITYTSPGDLDFSEHAFLYHDGRVQDLHASFFFEGRQSFASTAVDINELGQVLVLARFHGLDGKSDIARFYLWDDGQATDLDAILEKAGVSRSFPSPPMLNDVGQIALNGIDALGLTTPYLITPIPEPSTYVLMLAGLGTLAMVARRRKHHSSASLPASLVEAEVAPET